MFKAFYKDAQELHEAIKRIRNVWIPLERGLKSIVKEGVLWLYPAYTHYKILDDGSVEYSIQSKSESYPLALLHFEAHYVS